MNNEPAAFASWAICEVIGHQRFAGYLQEQTIGGNSFIRIAIPEVPAARGYKESLPAFTKLFTQGAIFCITPCTEETARNAAKLFRAQPAVCLYDLPSALSQHRLTYSDEDRDDDDNR